MNTPRPSFGTTPATHWHPRRYRQFDEFTASARGGSPPRSAFSGPLLKGLKGADCETKTDAIIAAIVHDFHEHGFRSGMREASRYGLQEAAQLYVDVRAETEEQLSSRLAKIRSLLTHDRCNSLLQAKRGFLEARLLQVRAAVKEGRTPPQAVRDRPEVVRKEVRRWVPYAALAVGLIALLRS